MILSQYGFHASQKMLDVLEVLKSATGGRFATIHGYIPLTVKDWLELPEYDTTIITRFSTEKLYQRRLEALEGITLADCDKAIANDPVLSTYTPAALAEMFEVRKAMEVQSMTKSRVDTAAHREGQTRCHVNICNGVRVHLKTEKKDGIMVPILENGAPVAESIRLNAIQQARRYIKKGVRKIVNSGAPVRISNAIQSVLNLRSVGFTSFTLADNFQSVSIDGDSITPEDIL